MGSRRSVRRADKGIWVLFALLLVVAGVLWVVRQRQHAAPVDEPAPAADTADEARDADPDDVNPTTHPVSLSDDTPPADAAPTETAAPVEEPATARVVAELAAPAADPTVAADDPATAADPAVAADPEPDRFDDADLATALARGRLGADDAAATVERGRTSTGLTRYTTSQDEAQRDAARARLAASADEGSELDDLRRAMEADPTDADALEALLAGLVHAERDDEALEWLARFVEAGGDPERARSHAGLDPFATARATLLRDAAQAQLDAAAVARDKARWLVAAACLDRAERHARAARGPLSGAPDDRADGRLADLLQRERDALFSRRDAVDRLAAWGAPLPAHVDPDRTALQRARAEAADAAAERRGESVEARSGRILVRTDVSQALAEELAELLDVLHDQLVEEFGHDPLRGATPVLVEVLAEAATWETRRSQAEPPIPPWRRASLLGADHLAGGEAGGSEARPERHVLAVDPLALGEDRALLAGRLAREVARLALRSASAGRLPLWLEEGFVTRYEGARRRADGQVELDRPPSHLRRRLGLSAAGHGQPPRDLREVLDLQRMEHADVPWAWGLVQYLVFDLDDQGAPRWRERWRSLLVASRAGDVGLGLNGFVEHVLQGGDAGPIDGIDTLAGFERAWRGWIADEAALDRGEAAATHGALTRIVRALERRDVQGAEDVVRRVLRARPDDALGLQLSMRTAEARRDHDGALLAALALAEARLPSGEWTVHAGQLGNDRAQRAASEELRFNEAWSLQEDVARAALAADLDTRMAVESLVSRQLAEGCPRAAVRLLDDALSAQPLDAGYRVMRAAVVAERLEPDDLLQRWRADATSWLERAHGDISFWTDTGSDRRTAAPGDDVRGPGALRARCADRLQPVTLDGLLDLRPPCRVSVRLDFAPHPTRGNVGDETTWAGLTLGAADPVVPGNWAVFVGPDGRVALAQRARFDWPAVGLGRGARGAVQLELDLGATGFEVLADGTSLGWQPYGPRSGRGWLGLYARHVDVTFEGLEVRRVRGVDPREAWWLGGRP